MGSHVDSERFLEALFKRAKMPNRQNIISLALIVEKIYNVVDNDLHRLFTIDELNAMLDINATLATLRENDTNGVQFIYDT